MAPSRKSVGAGAEKKKKTTELTKATKTVATKRKEEPKSKSKSSNGVAKVRKDSVVPSSSTESQTRKEAVKKGGNFANQRITPTKPKPKTKTETKPNSKANAKPKQKLKSKAQPKARLKSKGGKGKEEEEDGEDEVEEGSVVCAFPMNRIKVIIRSGGAADSRITQEAIFLINKASEKFIENMCEDSYNSDKNYFGYKHISSLVGRERRYDFLSDFVPKRVKAEDALAQRQAAES